MHRDEWEDMHRTAHALGVRTTATMMFGCGEEFRHRVNHLERVRRIQDDTGGFTAFIPWIFAPDNTPLGKKVPEATAVDYLKTLAISRLYLDNIDHIQSSWLTPGNQNLPGGTAVRRRRRRQHPDRGKRGLRRRRPQPHQRSPSCAA
jgi:cyclic dehypoxanthinyl futalosine synthase